MHCANLHAFHEYFHIVNKMETPQIKSKYHTNLNDFYNLLSFFIHLRSTVDKNKKNKFGFIYL